MKFPIHPSDRHILAWIPWEVVAAHEAQAQHNHSQTLKRLAERGGLALSELAAVLEDRRWHEMSNEESLRVIHAAWVPFTI